MEKIIKAAIKAIIISSMIAKAFFGVLVKIFCIISPISWNLLFIFI
jgi:hypothetical protein